MAAKLAAFFSHKHLFERYCKHFRAASLNQKIRIHILAQNKSNSCLQLPQNGGGISLKVLFEDPWLLAVDKPPRLLVHRCKEASKQECKENLFVKDIAEQQLTKGRPLYPVHRLDRPASGVLIFAKSGQIAHQLQQGFASPACQKQYVVLARGKTPQTFICDEPVKDEKGIPREALTECKKLLDLPQARCSLLQVVIRTGRWHQIRKHLNHRGHHVVGDSVHGKGGTNRFFREFYNLLSARCFLHAHLLSLPHPSIYALPPSPHQVSIDSLSQSEDHMPFEKRKSFNVTVTENFKEAEGLSPFKSARVEDNENFYQNFYRSVNEHDQGLSPFVKKDSEDLNSFIEIDNKYELKSSVPLLQIISPLPLDLQTVLLSLPDEVQLSTLKELSLL